MKDNKTLLYIFLISIQFLFNFEIINSFGIKDVDPHLLIYFLQENKKTNTEMLSEENFMKAIMYKNIYSKFRLGVPTQNLDFYFEMNNNLSSISEEYYFKNRSMTYKLIDSRYWNVSHENNNFEINDTKGYLSQDIFELSQKKKIDNFTFLLKPKNKEERIKNLNTIGLNYNTKNDTLSLLSKLKENKYIHQKVFSYLFGDDAFSENSLYDGQMLFGVFPHDISPDFDEDELYYYTLNNKDDENWHIKFDSVRYKEDDLKDKIVELDMNLNVIIGPEKFRKKLLNTFFRDFIENKKCKENYFIGEKDGQKYIFYTFDQDVFFKEVPILYFYSKDLNDTFKLSFSNLFERFQNRFYFKVIFKKKPDNKWVFGQIFFNAYKFVFDLEEGKIGYYKSYSANNHPFIVLICVAVFGLIFLLGYLRGLSIKKRDEELYGNKQPQIPIRKEYTDSPSTNNKEKDKINQKKEENKNEKITKEDNKVDNQKLKKE